ncbi:MAG: hypothetical protein V1676_03585 [Candidatus Diapherotrites archaeon]
MQLGKCALFAPAVLLIALVAGTVLLSGCAQAPREGMFTASLQGEPVTVTFGLRSADTFTGGWLDTYVRSNNPAKNYSGNNYYSLVQGTIFHYAVNLSSGIPTGADITSAKLCSYVSSSINCGSPYWELRSLGKEGLDITKDTWNTYDGVNSWTNQSGGADDGIALGRTLIATGLKGRYCADFDAQGVQYLEGRAAGGQPARFMLRQLAEGTGCDACSNGDCSARTIRTAEDPDATRPYLEIAYTPGGGGQYCTDGTAYGVCSTAKPKKCVNGTLADVCSQCGCGTGLTCDANGSCKVQQQECTNGQAQQCGTTDVGACEYGTQTCTNGSWGACTGEVSAGTEICGNGIDEDCDGADSECGAGGTYYVCGTAEECNSGKGSGWGTGNDSYACTSKAQPCKTVTGATKKMASGDTAIIGDGIYTGEENRVLYNMIPNGSAGSYTAIRAENPFYVTLDGGYSLASAGDYTSMLTIKGNSYVHVDGILFFRGGGGVHGSDHIKVTRCGFGEASYMNCVSYGFIIGSTSSHILVEDSFVFGSGRYLFGVSSTGGFGSSHDIVFRRCLARADYYYNDPNNDKCGMISHFSNYQQKDVSFQNCIAIDGLEWYPDGGGSYPGFMIPNGCVSTYIEGSIVLNIVGNGILSESTAREGIHVKDTVIWDTRRGRSNYQGVVRIGADNGLSTFESMTTGHTDANRGWGKKEGTQNSDVKNSILYGFTNVRADYAANDTFDINNSSFYSNRHDGKTGNNPILDVDPIWSPQNPTGSLKYLPRIEPGSALYTAGQDGEPVGATILKKIGVTGTLAGEEGWNSVTNDSLWPPPYENEYKRIMCDEQYNLHKGEVDKSGNPVVFGGRGFCANGTGLYGGPVTLTSYIWEYLGNECPHDNPGDPCYYDVLPCGQGEITGNCLCSGQEHGSGYCCSGNWQQGACMQNCGEGAITGTCRCGGVEYGSGYCCSGVWQAGACTQGCEQQGKIECNGVCVTPTCSSNEDCPQWKECRNAGTCTAKCATSLPGLVNYIGQWRSGSLSLTQIVAKIAEWKQG